MMFFALATLAFAAFLVQGVTGFGAALILAPTMLFFLDLQGAVVAAALVQVPIGGWLTTRGRHYIEREVLLRMLPLSLLGLVVGTIALANVRVSWLQLLCGVLTSLFAIRMLLRPNKAGPHRPWPSWSIGAAALTSGLLGGIFGTSGPPIVAYCERHIPEPAVFRATLIAYFLVLNTLRVLGYASILPISETVLLASMAMLPAALFGAWLGEQIQQRMNAYTFRNAVAVVLLITGLMLVFKA